MWDAKSMSKKILFIALLVITLLFVGARAVHLLADFPATINWSGDLYTDEGWYSSGAMHQYLSANWLVPGDFNPILSMPFFHLVQYLAFRFIGMSLTSARYVALFFFALALLAVWLLLRLHQMGWQALIVILFLSSDYLIFLYSRLAFLEIPMLALVLWSLYLIEFARKKNQNLLLLLAGFFYLMAVLTKTTAIFALPVLILDIAYGWQGTQLNFIRPLFFAVPALLPWAIFTFVTRCLFPADIQYFSKINFQDRLVFYPLQVIKNFKNVFFSEPLLGQPILWVLLLSFGLIFLSRGYVIRNRLLQIFCLLSLLYAAMLSFSSYLPPRYLIPLLVLCNLIFGLILVEFLNSRKFGFYQYVFLLMAVGLLIWNANKVFNYIAAPEYTFAHMLSDVKNHISTEKPGSIVIIGSFSNTVGLDLNVETYNTFQGTKDLDWKIQQYRPSYYLALGEDPKELEILKKYYILNQIGNYEVFHNYYYGRSVIFYRLDPR